MEPIFNPKTVALIGATEREGAVGTTLMKNLLLGQGSRNVYPINPGRESVMGVKCYPRVGNLPEPVDLAVIATPATTVPAVVAECGQAGVKGVVIISAGFRETGQKGRELEDEIHALRTRYGMRIVGPNCVGVIRPPVSLNASFLRRNPEPGSVAFISQSGALGAAILDWAISSGIGFSLFASLGSMLDVDFGDLIDFLGTDPHTRSILIYMESVGHARKFMSAARGFARTKPIIVMKPGKSAEASRAARSHTGALAGSFEVYEAAFRRVGVVGVDGILDLFNCASVLDARYLPAGPRIALVTNAGGPGVIAADALHEFSGTLAELSPQTITDLDASLPSAWSHGNPVDVLGDADESRYVRAISTCVSDPNVDGVVVIYTPQGVASPVDLAKATISIAGKKIKPLLTVWMGEDDVRSARQLFHSHDVPTYATPEEAIKTYMHMYRYKRNLELLYETPEEMPVDAAPPRNHLKLLLRRVLQEGRTLLTEDEAGKFLDTYGISRPKGIVCKSVEEALRAAATLGYPLVLKIISPEVSHKTDVGSVITGVNSDQELRESYTRLVHGVQERMPQASIRGVFVQKMVKEIDYELILGSRKDADFGAVILFGAGGIAVELFKDTAIGLPPLNQTLARRLMEEVRIYGMLRRGFRNKPPADLRELEETLVRFSNLVIDFPEIAEMDINPLAISRDGNLWALDARIVLDAEAALRTDPYSHLVILPYPTKYVMPWRLKDGTEVLLRPIRPEDEPLEEELIRGFSEETSRFRFFQVIREITHEMLVRFCNIDYDREMAIIAEYSGGGRRRNIGVGRLIMEPDKKRGEFAVVVADDFQGKGLGTKLVDFLIEIAEEKDLESIYGIVLPENTKMIDLCRRLGFEIRYKDDSFMVELYLKRAAEQAGK